MQHLEALPTPVLEVGGTHVTAALVAEGQERTRILGEGSWRVLPNSIMRRDLDAHAPAARLLDELARTAEEATARAGGQHTGHWGAAVPGPFDYTSGIARYTGVGKFDSLNGVDVGAGLMDRLGPAAAGITFLNDADAFGLGEFALGTAGGSRRCVCITLGTGVGSVFLADGIPVKTGTDVPPDGSCYLLQYHGKPLEDTVSRRAIRRAYASAAAVPTPAGGNASDGGTSPGLPDVREIAAAARAGDPVAAAVVQHAFGSLGDALAPYLERFGADILIVGGSMAGSWDLVEPALRTGLAGAAPALAGMPITRAGHGEAAGLVGAAYWAGRAATDRR